MFFVVRGSAHSTSPTVSAPPPSPTSFPPPQALECGSVDQGSKIPRTSAPKGGRRATKRGKGEGGGEGGGRRRGGRSQAHEFRRALPPAPARRASPPPSTRVATVAGRRASTGRTPRRTSPSRAPLDRRLPSARRGSRAQSRGPRQGPAQPLATISIFL